MSAKMSAARREAFLAALAETGNQTLAAERAKVSRSWVSLHRASDAAFRAELEAAIATAKARLGAADAVRPHAGWRTLAGEELVVRGSNGRRAQIARARVRQWTRATEARFLSTLAASCNVKAACETVGLSQESAYTHRKRWPAFAARWQEALEIGYDRIHGALVDGAHTLFGQIDYDPAERLAPMTVDQALQLMRLHQSQVNGTGQSPGRKLPPPTREEVDAALTKALERHAHTLARREEAAAVRAARRAAGRTADG